MDSVNSIISSNFFGFKYGLYIIIGYLLSKGVFKKIKSSNLSICFLFSMIACCAIQIIAYNNGIKYDVWYDSIFILLASVSLFELVSRIKIKENTFFIKACSYLSNRSLAIFFIHVLLLHLYKTCFNIFNIKCSIKVWVLFLLTSVLSIIIIWLFSRIKIIKEKILVIKD